MPLIQQKRVDSEAWLIVGPPDKRSYRKVLIMDTARVFRPTAEVMNAFR
jgi:hypothetical protein